MESLSSSSDTAWRCPTSHRDGGGKLRAVETFTGSRVSVLEGNGADDPYREVVHYFDENGYRIAVRDPLETA